MVEPSGRSPEARAQRQKASSARCTSPGPLTTPSRTPWLRVRLSLSTLAPNPSLRIVNDIGIKEVGAQSFCSPGSTRPERVLAIFPCHFPLSNSSRCALCSREHAGNGVREPAADKVEGDAVLSKSLCELARREREQHRLELRRMLYFVITCSNFSATIHRISARTRRSAAAVIADVSTVASSHSILYRARCGAEHLPGGVHAIFRLRHVHSHIRARHSSHQCRAWTTWRTS